MTSLFGFELSVVRLYARLSQDYGHTLLPIVMKFGINVYVRIFCISLLFQNDVGFVCLFRGFSSQNHKAVVVIISKQSVKHVYVMRFNDTTKPDVSKKYLATDIKL